MCVVGTVVPLGRLMDALIGLGINGIKVVNKSYGLLHPYQEANMKWNLA